MIRPISNAAFWGILLFVFLIISLSAQSPKKFHSEYFLGYIVKGDADLNPNLDFVITTQQRPGQDHAIDNIQNQPFQSIAVHRDYNKEDAKAIEKIGLEINNILLKNKFNKVLVFGRYSTNPQLTKGHFNGFLELTSIWIYDKEGNKEVYMIEGVYGGVR